MNAVRDFFSSVKADLLDRRLLPSWSCSAVALVAAVAYAVLGGGSSAAPAPAPRRRPPRLRGDWRVRQPGADEPQQPVAETTAAVQAAPGTRTTRSRRCPKRRSAPRTSTTASPRARSTTPSAGSTPSAPSSGGTTPTTPKETTPAKPKVTSTTT